MLSTITVHCLSEPNHLLSGTECLLRLLVGGTLPSFLKATLQMIYCFEVTKE